MRFAEVLDRGSYGTAYLMESSKSWHGLLLAFLKTLTSAAFQAMPVFPVMHLFNVKLHFSKLFCQASEIISKIMTRFVVPYKS